MTGKGHIGSTEGNGTAALVDGTAVPGRFPVGKRGGSGDGHSSACIIDQCAVRSSLFPAGHSRAGNIQEHSPGFFSTLCEFEDRVRSADAAAGHIGGSSGEDKGRSIDLDIQIVRIDQTAADRKGRTGTVDGKAIHIHSGYAVGIRIRCFGSGNVKGSANTHLQRDICSVELGITCGSFNGEERCLHIGNNGQRIGGHHRQPLTLRIQDEVASGHVQRSFGHRHGGGAGVFGNFRNIEFDCNCFYYLRTATGCIPFFPLFSPVFVHKGNRFPETGETVSYIHHITARGDDPEHIRGIGIHHSGSGNIAVTVVEVIPVESLSKLVRSIRVGRIIRIIGIDIVKGTELAGIIGNRGGSHTVADRFIQEEGSQFQSTALGVIGRIHGAALEDQGCIAVDCVTVGVQGVGSHAVHVHCAVAADDRVVDQAVAVSFHAVGSVEAHSHLCHSQSTFGIGNGISCPAVIDKGGGKDIGCTICQIDGRTIGSTVFRYGNIAQFQLTGFIIDHAAVSCGSIAGEEVPVGIGFTLNGYSSGIVKHTAVFSRIAVQITAGGFGQIPGKGCSGSHIERTAFFGSVTGNNKLAVPLQFKSAAHQSYGTAFGSRVPGHSDIGQRSHITQAESIFIRKGVGVDGHIFQSGPFGAFRKIHTFGSRIPGHSDIGQRSLVGNSKQCAFGSRIGVDGHIFQRSGSGNGQKITIAGIVPLNSHIIQCSIVSKDHSGSNTVIQNFHGIQIRHAGNSKQCAFGGFIAFNGHGIQRSGFANTQNSAIPIVVQERDIVQFGILYRIQDLAAGGNVVFNGHNACRNCRIHCGIRKDAQSGCSCNPENITVIGIVPAYCTALVSSIACGIDHRTVGGCVGKDIHIRHGQRFCSIDGCTVCGFIAVNHNRFQSQISSSIDRTAVLFGFVTGQGHAFNRKSTVSVNTGSVDTGNVVGHTAALHGHSSIGIKTGAVFGFVAVNGTGVIQCHIAFGVDTATVFGGCVGRNAYIVQRKSFGTIETGTVPGFVGFHRHIGQSQSFGGIDTAPVFRGFIEGNRSAFHGHSSFSGIDTGTLISNVAQSSRTADHHIGKNHVALGVNTAAQTIADIITIGIQRGNSFIGSQRQVVQSQRSISIDTGSVGRFVAADDSRRSGISKADCCIESAAVSGCGIGSNRSQFLDLSTIGIIDTGSIHSLIQADDTRIGQNAGCCIVDTATEAAFAVHSLGSVARNSGRRSQRSGVIDTGTVLGFVVAHRYSFGKSQVLIGCVVDTAPVFTGNSGVNHGIIDTHGTIVINSGTIGSTVAHFLAEYTGHRILALMTELHIRHRHEIVVVDGSPFDSTVAVEDTARHSRIGSEGAVSIQTAPVARGFVIADMAGSQIGTLHTTTESNTGSVLSFIVTDGSRSAQSQVTIGVDTAPEAAVAISIRLGSVVLDDRICHIQRAHGIDTGSVGGTVAQRIIVTGIVCTVVIITAHRHIVHVQGTFSVESAAQSGGYIAVHTSALHSHAVFCIDTCAVHTGCIFAHGTTCIHTHIAFGVDTGSVFGVIGTYGYSGQSKSSHCIDTAAVFCGCIIADSYIFKGQRSGAIDTRSIFSCGIIGYLSARHCHAVFCVDTAAIGCAVGIGFRRAAHRNSGQVDIGCGIDTAPVDFGSVGSDCKSTAFRNGDGSGGIDPGSVLGTVVTDTAAASGSGFYMQCTCIVDTATVFIGSIVTDHSIVTQIDSSGIVDTATVFDGSIGIGIRSANGHIGEGHCGSIGHIQSTAVCGSVAGIGAVSEIVRIRSSGIHRSAIVRFVSAEGHAAGGIRSLQVIHKGSIQIQRSAISCFVSAEGGDRVFCHRQRASGIDRAAVGTGSVVREGIRSRQGHSAKRIDRSAVDSLVAFGGIRGIPEGHTGQGHIGSRTHIQRTAVFCGTVIGEGTLAQVVCISTGGIHRSAVHRFVSAEGHAAGGILLKGSIQMHGSAGHRRTVAFKGKYRIFSKGQGVFLGIIIHIQSTAVERCFVAFEQDFSVDRQTGRIIRASNLYSSAPINRTCCFIPGKGKAAFKFSITAIDINGTAMVTRIVTEGGILHSQLIFGQDHTAIIIRIVAFKQGIAYIDSSVIINHTAGIRCTVFLEGQMVGGFGFCEGFSCDLYCGFFAHIDHTAIHRTVLFITAGTAYGHYCTGPGGVDHTALGTGTVAAGRRICQGHIAQRIQTGSIHRTVTGKSNVGCGQSRNRSRGAGAVLIECAVAACNIAHKGNITHCVNGTHVVQRSSVNTLIPFKTYSGKGADLAFVIQTSSVSGSVIGIVSIDLDSIFTIRQIAFQYKFCIFGIIDPANRVIGNTDTGSFRRSQFDRSGIVDPGGIAIDFHGTAVGSSHSQCARSGIGDTGTAIGIDSNFCAGAVGSQFDLSGIVHSTPGIIGKRSARHGHSSIGIVIFIGIVIQTVPGISGCSIESIHTHSNFSQSQRGSSFIDDPVSGIAIDVTAFDAVRDFIAGAVFHIRIVEDTAMFFCGGIAGKVDFHQIQFGSCDRGIVQRCTIFGPVAGNGHGLDQIQTCSSVVDRSALDSRIVIHRSTAFQSQNAIVIDTAAFAAVTILGFRNVVGDLSSILQRYFPVDIEPGSVLSFIGSFRRAAHRHAGEGHAVVTRSLGINGSALDRTVGSKGAARHGQTCSSSINIQTAAQFTGFIEADNRSIGKLHIAFGINTGSVLGAVGSFRRAAHRHIGKGQITGSINGSAGSGFIGSQEHIRQSQFPGSVNTGAVGRTVGSNGSADHFKIFGRIDGTAVDRSFVAGKGAACQIQFSFFSHIDPGSVIGSFVVFHRTVAQRKIAVGIDPGSVSAVASGILHSFVAFHSHVAHGQRSDSVDTRTIRSFVQFDRSAGNGNTIFAVDTAAGHSLVAFHNGSIIQR